MRRSGPAALAALSLASLASCSGPLLFAEVEIPDLRVTLPQQSFPAFDAGNPANWCDPSGPPPPIPCVALSTAYDLGAHVPALTEKGVTYELRVTDVEFTLSATQSSPGAPTDLGGIQSATVRVGWDPAVPGSGVVIAKYVRATAGTPTTVAISGNANLDLAPYISSGNLPVRVEVVIDGPTSAFDADILAAFYVRVTLDWGKYL
jgi:hypothetical protein